MTRPRRPKRCCFIHIQPDRLRLLLLIIRSTRPTVADVPLADLSF